MGRHLELTKEAGPNIKIRPAVVEYTEKWFFPLVMQRDGILTRSPKTPLTESLEEFLRKNTEACMTHFADLMQKMVRRGRKSNYLWPLGRLHAVVFSNFQLLFNFRTLSFNLMADI